MPYLRCFEKVTGEQKAADALIGSEQRESIAFNKMSYKAFY